MRDGRLRLKMDGGRAVELDARRHPHLDHGYAVTSHSSQGQTADRVLIHVDTELGAKDLLNSRMAYVAVSRGAYDAQLFTNDREKLGSALGHDVSHQSAHMGRKGRPSSPSRPSGRLVHATSRSLVSRSVCRTYLYAPDGPIGVEANLVSLPSVSNAGPSINGQPTQRKEPSVEGQLPGQKVTKDYLQLHLDVSNPSSRDIVGAQFTVHGFSRKLRVIDPSDSSNAPDLWRTIDVALDVQAKGHASNELSLTHFTAIITSIDLDSFTYADGTQWQASSPGACSITPNMVMRISPQ